MNEVEHISKAFKVSRRNAGFSEAFRALFHKRYECIKALNDISFHIKEGEMVGYIGPNGEVTDISVDGPSIDEIVATLYHQYQI